MPGTPTTKYAIPTFAAGGTDPVNTGHTQINSALTAVDGSMAGYATGTFAGKPAAGKAGRLYLCTDTGQWLADTGSVWVDLNSAPAFVSSLPVSPYDGQEIYYQADLTNGVIWHLRYRSASASAYKWEFVGGSSLTSEVVASQSTTSTAYIDLATVGPSITVPLAGDYDFDFAVAAQSASSSTGAAAVLKIGAAAAANAEAVYVQDGSSVMAALSRSLVRNVAAASTVVKLVYGCYSLGLGGTVTFERRTLRARPIRVG